MPDKFSQKPHILILGAGCAGLSAASELLNKGYKVTILEASPRIFGRVETTKLNGIPIDLGAAWLHGDENPLNDAARLMHIPMHHDALIEVVPSNAIPSETVYNFARRYKQELLRTGRASLENPAPQGKVEKDFVELLFAQADAADDQELLSAADCLSTVSREAGNLPEGGMEKFLTQYFAPVINHPKCKIILNSPVLEIQNPRLGRGKQVAFVDLRGDKHFGDYAVATCSIGVLKSGLIKFSPRMPEEIKFACDNIHMGSMNKVVLHMSESFFEQHQIPYTSHLNFISADLPPLFALARPAGQPVLMCLMAGDISRQLEKSGADAMREYVITHLEQAYGVGVRSQIIASVCTSWNTNQYTLGSYSAIGPDKEISARNAKPSWDGRLHLAGEAFGGEWATQIYGAILSGEQTAKQIALHAQKSR